MSRELIRSVWLKSGRERFNLMSAYWTFHPLLWGRFWYRDLGRGRVLLVFTLGQPSFKYVICNKKCCCIVDSWTLVWLAVVSSEENWLNLLLFKSSRSKLTNNVQDKVQNIWNIRQLVVHLLLSEFSKNGIKFRVHILMLSCWLPCQWEQTDFDRTKTVGEGGDRGSCIRINHIGGNRIVYTGG